MDTASNTRSAPNGTTKNVLGGVGRLLLTVIVSPLVAFGIVFLGMFALVLGGVLAIPFAVFTINEERKERQLKREIGFVVRPQPFTMRALWHDCAGMAGYNPNLNFWGRASWFVLAGVCVAAIVYVLATTYLGGEDRPLVFLGLILLSGVAVLVGQLVQDAKDREWLKTHTSRYEEAIATGEAATDGDNRNEHHTATGQSS